MPRQLTVIYHSHWGSMGATVLLTWVDHGNFLIIITQHDLHLIISCWKKMWISNRFFQGKSCDSAYRNNETTVEVFLTGRRCWAFKCLHVLYIIGTVYLLLKEISTYMLTEMLYLISAKGSVHTNKFLSYSSGRGEQNDLFLVVPVSHDTYYVIYLVHRVVFMCLL